MSLLNPTDKDFRIVAMTLNRFHSIPKTDYPQEMYDIYGDFGADTHTMLANLIQTSGAKYAILPPKKTGDNTTLAYMGVSLMWPGVARMWAVMLIPGRRNTYTMLKGTKLMLERVAAEWGLHRMEMSLRCDKPWVFNVAKVLGFEVEPNPMRQYSASRADYMLAARIFNNET